MTPSTSSLPCAGSRSLPSGHVDFGSEDDAIDETHNTGDSDNDSDSNSNSNSNSHSDSDSESYSDSNSDSDNESRSNTDRAVGELLASQRERKDIRRARARLAGKIRAAYAQFTVFHALRTLDWIGDQVVVVYRITAWVFKWFASIFLVMLLLTGILLAFGYAATHATALLCTDLHIQYMSSWMPTLRVTDICANMATLRHKEAIWIQKLESGIGNTALIYDSLTNLTVPMEYTNHYGPMLEDDLQLFSSFIAFYDAHLHNVTALHSTIDSLIADTREMDEIGSAFRLSEAWHRDIIASTTRILSEKAQILLQEQDQGTFWRATEDVFYYFLPFFFDRSPTGLFITRYVEFLDEQITGTNALLEQARIFLELLSAIKKKVATLKLILAVEQKVWDARCLPDTPAASGWWMWISGYRRETSPPSEFCVQSPVEHSAMLDDANEVILWLLGVISQTHKEYKVMRQDFSVLSSQLKHNLRYATSTLFKPTDKHRYGSEVVINALSGAVNQPLLDSISARRSLTRIIPALEAIHVYIGKKQVEMEKHRAWVATTKAQGKANVLRKGLGR